MWERILRPTFDKLKRDRQRDQSLDLAQALAGQQHTDPEVRRQAASRLGRFSDPAAISALRELLEDPIPAVRATAALSLGILGAPEAAGPLLDHFLNDASPQVRMLCGSHLEQFDDPRIPSALIQALQDPDWQVVTGACVGIELRMLREAVPALWPLLAHPHPSVQERGCSALLALDVRDPRIVSTLEALMQDPWIARSEEFGRAVGPMIAEVAGDEEVVDAETVSDLLKLARKPPA